MIAVNRALFRSEYRREGWIRGETFFLSGAISRCKNDFDADKKLLFCTLINTKLEYKEREEGRDASVRETGGTVKCCRNGSTAFVYGSTMIDVLATKFLNF